MVGPAMPTLYRDGGADTGSTDTLMRAGSTHVQKELVDSLSRGFTNDVAGNR